MTPRFDYRPFLASLMTLVSIKYIGVPAVVVSLKIFVLTHIRHGRQHQVFVIAIRLTQSGRVVDTNLSIITSLYSAWVFGSQ